MTFSEQLKRFQEKVEFRSHEHFVETASTVFDSIVNGSTISNSPGQPVGQYGPGYHEGKIGGYLKASWKMRFASKDVAVIETNAPYAESIEDGLSYAHGGKPMELHSTVGGFHSLALTRAAIQALADDAAKRLYGSEP